MSNKKIQSQSTPDSSPHTMLVVRLSPALKRAVESAAEASGDRYTSDWVRRLLVLHTDKEAACADS